MKYRLTWSFRNEELRHTTNVEAAHVEDAIFELRKKLEDEYVKQDVDLVFVWEIDLL